MRNREVPPSSSEAVDQDRLFDLTPAHRQIQEKAARFAREIVAPRAAEIDETDQYPTDIVRKLAEAGFMGMTAPEEYGGSNATLLDATLVAEEIAKASGVVARIVVDANTAVPGAIINYGTAVQKQRYLPWIVAGDKPAIAITEPDAGSAASELMTAAKREGDVWVLNGRKRWISGGGVSRLYLIYARFDGRAGPKGIGGVLVESANPGLTVERVRKIMGLRGMPEADILLQDCRVSPQSVLIPPADGFSKLMRAYNRQRVGAAAIALGIAQAAFDHALQYVQQRKQFGRFIGEFQGLQWMLADMHVRLEAVRLLVYRAASHAGHGFPDPVETAVAKLVAAEDAINITNMALQLHGAIGYSCELPLERMVRDVRMYAIGGGTTQVLRNLIASRLLPKGFVNNASRRPDGAQQS
jgi:alkylation response protein AidB-like acyl-CoA dehydrogenase